MPSAGGGALLIRQAPYACSEGVCSVGFAVRCVYVGWLFLSETGPGVVRVPSCNSQMTELFLIVAAGRNQMALSVRAVTEQVLKPGGEQTSMNADELHIFRGTSKNLLPSCHRSKY